ncbi:hypothetical protein L3X38_000378 [Prunus dulcis]|uniref:Uncharacterized protein n=1 Tax=Prunus dulcis TaxID=3755 RepID=A0AAD4UR66_PRUDU|nr:hypothetical protein L3X38_000378 [Prunus dulcis]
MLPSFIARDAAGFYWSRSWDFSAKSRLDGAGQCLELLERPGLSWGFHGRRNWGSAAGAVGRSQPGVLNCCSWAFELGVLKLWRSSSSSDIEFQAAENSKRRKNLPRKNLEIAAGVFEFVANWAEEF